MNYYERHLGDYSKNASHLSLLEHGVYVRLIDVYYTREAPIPDDKAARLIAARTEPETQALQVVLQEFFQLRDGHWHQDRCDEEIAAYIEGEPEREVKKANEDNRLKRHRAERSDLFRVLVNAGRHAPWNIGIVELRKLAAECVAGVAGSGPATRTATATATPATATHSPFPTPHSPLPTSQKEEISRGSGVVPDIAPKTAAVAAPTPKGQRLPADWVLPKAWGEWALTEYPKWTPDKVRLEADKFRDHWVPKTGKDATKTDWLGTWRNWCRSDIAHRDDPKPNGRAPVVDLKAKNAEAKRLLGFDHREILDV